MLESFRKGQRWLTLIFVSVIGLVFVFFFGSGGGGFGPATPSGNAIVQLDEIRLTSRDLAREKETTERRLRAELGDSYDQLGADRFLDSQAFSALINNLVLSTAAADMGLHVTKDEIRRVVQTFPIFIDEEGRFSPEAFDRFAQYNYGSQRAFIQTFTRELLGQKLVQLLIGQTTVSDSELDLQVRYELEEVRLALVKLDATTLPSDENLDDAAIEAFAAENEEALRATYAEREAGLALPPRVRARHILALASADASPEEEAEARGRAEAALARIQGGEAFEDVAKDASDDAITAAKGGDLGIFAEGDNDPAVDAAAFSLDAGAVSEVVRSAYGFHLLRVEEKLPAEDPSFDAHRLDLAREAATSARAAELADARATTLAGAIDAGQSLEEAADGIGLSVDRPPAVKRRPDGYVPGLGAAEELLTTAFTLSSGESSSTVFDVEGQRVLMQVLDRTAPDEEAISADRAARRGRAESQKQNLVLQSWLDDYRKQLETSGRLMINAELALGS
ncbi:MAG: SurA N-terminal domain-containing protein [Myxococcota bacterium]